MLNGGDFILRTFPTKELFYEHIYNHGFKGQNVVFLSTPDVRFAYDPQTGREIGNTLNRYKANRSDLLLEWKSLLERDSAYLRGKGLSGLADWQDDFVAQM